MFEGKDDLFLVEQIKESNNEEALGELVNRHSGIFYSMINKLSSGVLTPTEVSDIKNDKELEFHKIALDYDPECQCKFSTYLATRTKYLCLSQRGKNKKAPFFVDFEKVLEKKEDSSLFFEDLEEEEEKVYELSLIKEALDKTPKQTRQIFQERYFSGGSKLKSWQKIAKSVGLSTQGVINIHNRAIEKLKERVGKCE